MGIELADNTPREPRNSHEAVTRIGRLLDKFVKKQEPISDQTDVRPAQQAAEPSTSELEELIPVEPQQPRVKSLRRLE